MAFMNYETFMFLFLITQMLKNSQNVTLAGEDYLIEQNDLLNRCLPHSLFWVFIRTSPQKTPLIYPMDLPNEPMVELMSTPLLLLRERTVITFLFV
jgi:hypothetical protein